MHIANPNSHWNSVPGGPDTEDRIFLLSHDEAESLFANNDERKCSATAYAKKNNAYTADNGMCYWWLRSPGDSTNSAAYVSRGGDLYFSLVNNVSYVVRPSFKIAL